MEMDRGGVGPLRQWDQRRGVQTGCRSRVHHHHSPCFVAGAVCNSHLEMMSHPVCVRVMSMRVRVYGVRVYGVRVYHVTCCLDMCHMTCRLECTHTYRLMCHTCP